MRIVADTNILLRITMDDDPAQARAAAGALGQADVIAISIVSLCEFCWTLASRYKKGPDEIAHAVRRWISADRVAVDREVVDRGLQMLDAGGDFADGVIAHEGRRVGGDVFVTFDRQAATLLERSGHAVKLLPAARPDRPQPL